MFTSGKMLKVCLFGFAAVCFISLILNQLPIQEYLCKNPSVAASELENVEDELNPKTLSFPKGYVQVSEPSAEKNKPMDTRLQIIEIIKGIDQSIPKVPFAHLDNATCAKRSRATILNPRDQYCIGESLTVQLDMHDFLGNRKKHGSDHLRARIHSPELQAGAPGNTTDFQNGTYHVQFTLFWEGNVKISLLLIHPSEAVAALWRARNTGYDYVIHKAKYTSPTQTVETTCGYQINTKEEVCDYMSKKNEYPFYCIRPVNMSCSSLTQVSSHSIEHSYLSTLEKSLLDSSRFPIEIPHGLADLDVQKCGPAHTRLMEKCKPGMQLQYPGGHFVHNLWHPVSCSMGGFTTEEEIRSCLQGKSLLLIGDSTLMKWFAYLSDHVKTLKEFDLYDWGWQKTRLKIDPDRNIQIKYQKHGDPFLAMNYQVLDNPTIPEQIDRIGGNKNTVIVFTLGAHFKCFPLHLYIRRVINIREALQRLLLRSPETKVVVKTENVGTRQQQSELFSSFHGYIQYLIMNSMLRDLNISIVDTWEMSTAFDTDKTHVPPHVIENEIKFFLTFIC